MFVLLTIALLSVARAEAVEEPDSDAVTETTVAHRLSGRDLRRAAEDAARRGDLQTAYDLAREAYVERPSRAALRQVEALEVQLRSASAVAAR